MRSIKIIHGIMTIGTWPITHCCLQLNWCMVSRSCRHGSLRWGTLSQRHSAHSLRHVLGPIVSSGLGGALVLCSLYWLLGRLHTPVSSSQVNLMISSKDYSTDRGIGAPTIITICLCIFLCWFSLAYCSQVTQSERFSLRIRNLARPIQILKSRKPHDFPHCISVTAERQFVLETTAFVVGAS